MKTQKNTRLANAFFAEDSEADMALLSAFMKTDSFYFNFFTATDGEEAISLLGQEVTCKDFARPDLIFLDLNLPKKSGLEILKYVKESQLLSDIPVIVLSGSDYEKDINAAKKGGASYYLTKPLNLKKLKEAVNTIEGLNFSYDGEKENLCVAR